MALSMIGLIGGLALLMLLTIRGMNLFVATPLCALLVAGLAPATWLAFGVWSAAGLVVYFAYGRRRSELARHSAQGE